MYGPAYTADCRHLPSIGLDTMGWLKPPKCGVVCVLEWSAILESAVCEASLTFYSVVEIHGQYHFTDTMEKYKHFYEQFVCMYDSKQLMLHYLMIARGHGSIVAYAVRLQRC